MGWGKIPATKTRLANVAKRDELTEAFANDAPHDLVYGDPAWDIMDDCLDKVAEAYERAWGRLPMKVELVAVLDFCADAVIDENGYYDIQKFRDRLKAQSKAKKKRSQTKKRSPKKTKKKRKKKAAKKGGKVSTPKRKNKSAVL